MKKKNDIFQNSMGEDQFHMIHMAKTNYSTYTYNTSTIHNLKLQQDQCYGAKKQLMYNVDAKKITQTMWKENVGVMKEIL